MARIASLFFDTIKDRGQVRAMWHWARDLDAKDLLIREFAIPPGVTSGSPDDTLIRTEEGWTSVARLNHASTSLAAYNLLAEVLGKPCPLGVYSIQVTFAQAA